MPSGLSPRVRGNRRLRADALRLAWVYPRACGGTRASTPTSIERAGVYPRACGGTQAGAVISRFDNAMGLSPRVRGNLSPLRA